VNLILFVFRHPRPRRNHHVALTPPAAICAKPSKSDIAMRDKEQDLARRGTDNTKHQQEDSASRDYEKQREAGAKEMEAKTKKPKKSGQ
jgi:hypothetical protein